MDNQEEYDRARARVRLIRSFYIHATVFALVIGGLAAINLATTPHRLWFLWPLFGWGIGLAAHGIAVYGVYGLWGRDWEQRKIQQLLDKGRPR
jgi:hypothetical protein